MGTEAALFAARMCSTLRRYLQISAGRLLSRYAICGSMGKGWARRGAGGRGGEEAARDMHYNGRLIFVKFSGELL